VTPSPDALAVLLIDLGRAGVEVARKRTEPERLRYRPDTLPPKVLPRLRFHRDAILDLLPTIDGKGRYAPAHEDAAIVYGERLGMAEGLGMPTHPGSPAWLVAVGESMELGNKLAQSEVF
jgi:hypothetical protein